MKIQYSLLLVLLIGVSSVAAKWSFATTVQGIKDQAIAWIVKKLYHSENDFILNAPQTFQELRAKTIDFEEVAFSKLSAKVYYITNVATF